MCLAVPGKVERLRDDGKTAVIDYGDEKRVALNAANAKPGDWVLVQQKLVVEVLDERRAREALKALMKV